MSAVKGVTKTKIDAGTLENLDAIGTYNAEVLCMRDTYEAAGLAGASTLKMGGELPKGARVQEVVVGFDALSGDTVVDVGDSDDADRYCVDVDMSSAGFQRLEAVDGMDYVIGTADGDNQIVVTFTGASALTGTIKTAVFYTI